MERKLVITIDRDGKVKIEAVNFQGLSCSEAIDSIFSGMGKQISACAKPEFYLQEETGSQWLRTSSE